MEEYLTKYTFYVQEHDAFEIMSTNDAKAKFWEAKKCSYPTFEIVDSDGTAHVFVTDSVIALESKDM